MMEAIMRRASKSDGQIVDRVTGRPHHQTAWHPMDTVYVQGIGREDVRTLREAREFVAANIEAVVAANIEAVVAES